MKEHTIEAQREMFDADLTKFVMRYTNGDWDLKLGDILEAMLALMHDMVISGQLDLENDDEEPAGHAV